MKYIMNVLWSEVYFYCTGLLSLNVIPQSSCVSEHQLKVICDGREIFSERLHQY